MGLAELRILSPTAILGYGFPLESLERGLRDEPDAIAVDAGSTDPGPYYLGEGVPFVSDAAVERDLYYLLQTSLENEIPLLIGSAGGAGAKPHVNHLLALVKRVAKRLSRKLRVAVIWSDVSREYLLERLARGDSIEPAEGYPYGGLSPRIVKESIRIVAQAGVEPFMEALKLNVDLVVGGRSVDVAPFAALAWLRGFDRGLAVHMAKILECGAIAAEPGSGSDGMMGVLRRSEFEVYPLNPRRRATRVSVAEHALYERTNPVREVVPGGYADLADAVYEEIGGGRVVVRGTRWVEAERYMVKLEGVKLTGYRVIVFAGARDPDFISRLDQLVNEAIKVVEDVMGREGYRVEVHVYGRDAILKSWEPTPQPGHEVGLLIDVVADSWERAEAVASLMRSTLMHIGWPGRKTTAGNLALPLSPSEVRVGRVYEWSIWHLLELKDPLELFPIEEVVVG